MIGGKITFIAFHPSTSTVFLSTFRKIFVYDLKTSKMSFSFQAHDSNIEDLKVVGDKLWTASGKKNKKNKKN